MGAAVTPDGTRALRLASDAPYRRLVGVGGIGAGIFFALEGDHDLGRNESRPGRLLDVRDYCKLHIVAQYPTVLLGAREDQGPFHVVPVGKVGIDEVGLRLRAEMERAGMDVRFVDAVPGRPTLLSVCFQYPDGSGGNVTTVDSAAALVGERDVDLVERWLSPSAMALAAPEVPLAVRRHLLRRATEKGALRVASLTTARPGAGTGSCPSSLSLLNQRSRGARRRSPRTSRAAPAAALGACPASASSSLRRTGACRRGCSTCACLAVRSSARRGRDTMAAS
jgi:hypothetical protein